MIFWISLNIAPILGVAICHVTPIFWWIQKTVITWQIEKLLTFQSVQFLTFWDKVVTFISNSLYVRQKLKVFLRFNFFLVLFFLLCIPIFSLLSSTPCNLVLVSDMILSFPWISFLSSVNSHFTSSYCLTISPQSSIISALWIYCIIKLQN